MPSGQQIRQVATSFTHSVSDVIPDVIGNSRKSSERPASESQQSAVAQSHPAQVSCSDSRNNAKIFAGTIISVNSNSGLVIRFNSTSDGRIQASALPSNFVRLFRPDEQVYVSIKQASITNGQKRYELALVEEFHNAQILLPTARQFFS